MRRRLLIFSAAALLAGGCADGTESSVATSMSVGPSGITMDAVGMTQVVRAQVRDQRGNPMPGAEIRWSTSSDGVAVAGLGGDSAVVTSVRSGTTSYTAASGSTSATGVVVVTQAIASIRKADGDGQRGVVGTPLAAPLRVALEDRLGAPVPGIVVTFAVRSGNGSLSTSTAVSDANGIASAVWTLGNYTSELQQVSASAGVGRTVDFAATPVAGPAVRADEWGGDGQTIARGTALRSMPRVHVWDEHGNSAPGVAVRFTVTSGGGRVAGGEQVTDSSGMAEPDGWTVGTAVGVNTLSATFPGTAVPPLVLTAYAAIPGSVTVTAGDGQAAMAGSAVPVVPTVVVRDSAGRPLAGLAVTFEVAEGGGSVGTASTTTNASGVASPGSWTLGPAGATNRLKVQVREVTNHETDVRAVGCAGSGAGFTLTLCFTTDPGQSRRAVFQEAAARWSSIIRADLPDARGSIPANACDQGMPSADFVYDDLVIFASIRSIDGPGGVLGAAGPCFFRAGSNLPYVGVMIFDAADVAALERGGQFSSLILHEMGHVLGIGTIWPQLGLLKNASSAASRLDTYFSGTHALAGFNEIGGGMYSGQKVPVENGGGQGTINSHWRESVLRDELMTGYLNPAAPNPLSVLTARSLADLGYTVDASAADAFSLTFSQNADSAPRIRLHNDVYTGPRYITDRNGRHTRMR
jgi:hypothetical protein